MFKILLVRSLCGGEANRRIIQTYFVIIIVQFQLQSETYTVIYIYIYIYASVAVYYCKMLESGELTLTSNLLSAGNEPKYFNY